jgi:hypothetical protein
MDVITPATARLPAVNKGCRLSLGALGLRTWKLRWIFENERIGIDWPDMGFG